jgi:hypothetical protein
MKKDNNEKVNRGFLSGSTAEENYFKTAMGSGYGSIPLSHLKTTCESCGHGYVDGFIVRCNRMDVGAVAPGFCSHCLPKWLWVLIFRSEVKSASLISASTHKRK